MLHDCRHNSFRVFLFTVGFSTLLAGCSGRPRNVAPVKGKVTLGGQPLADALVTFSPVASGSPSSGRTNSNGEYELVYTRGVKGAEKGEHTVNISTFVFGNPDGDPPTTEVPEKVPYIYHEGDKKPKATVNSGANEINFDLEPGPVNPPQIKGKRGKRSAEGTCY